MLLHTVLVFNCGKCEDEQSNDNGLVHRPMHSEQNGYLVPLFLIIMGILIIISASKNRPVVEELEQSLEQTINDTITAVGINSNQLSLEYSKLVDLKDPELKKASIDSIESLIRLIKEQRNSLSSMTNSIEKSSDAFKLAVETIKTLDLQVNVVEVTLKGISAETGALGAPFTNVSNA